jgi:hypothetical protein
MDLDTHIDRSEWPGRRRCAQAADFGEHVGQSYQFKGKELSTRPSRRLSAHQQKSNEIHRLRSMTIKDARGIRLAIGLRIGSVNRLKKTKIGLPGDIIENETIQDKMTRTSKLRISSLKKRSIS